jgi:PAS domain S-box-containing protein
MPTARKTTRKAPATCVSTRHSEALLETASLQTAILNRANFSTIGTDPRGLIRIFDAGAERMLGYSAEEVIDTFTPADFSDPEEVFARATALGVEFAVPIAPGFEALAFQAARGVEDSYELTYIRKDGSRFPTVVSVSALRDARDAIIGYLFICTDNRLGKQSEETLLKTGALQNAIFNSANFSSIATDAQGVIQIFNVGAERMLGYAAADVMNKITPADISDPQEVIARAKALSLELGTPITPGFEALVFKASRGIEDIYELTYFRKDGSRFPAVVSVTALRDGQGTIIGYLLIGTDNTARKQAEEALLKAGALQSAIFNSANFSSIATDANGVIQIFNVGAERMLGYTAAEVMNKITPADISDPQEVVARAKALSVELETPITPGFEALVFKASRGIEDIYELTYIRKDGSRFPAVVSVTALRDAQEAIIGYLLIGTDNTARKQAEEALRQAGALQSAIFNSANFSSIATDAKGVIQIFNVGAERMLGYTAAEVRNKITPADISDPQEVVARAKALSVELETPITPGFEALVFKASRGIEDIYELTYIRKDGSRFPAVVSVTALRDAHNTIIGYLLIGTDNTARKEAEEELRQAGALQSAIFNSANFSSIATDAKGVIQIFNVGAERMLGYAAADVMNRITPADISDPQEVIARATALSVELATPITPGFEALVFKASRGIEDIYELTYIRKDGSRLPAVVSVTALRDAQEAIIGYLLIGTDNTARQQVEEERKKLDQRLRDQHFYTRSLIESNIDALMTCDPQGIITDINKQTETLTGCTRDELIGAPFKNSFTDPARAEAGIKRVLNEGKVTNYELTARAMDGTETVVSYNATTFHARDRSLQGVFAAARDVTELKRFEQTLVQKNAELEDASRMKSEFLANMSHELRTPLNAIIGFSEVLRDGLMGELTERQRGFISDIFGSGKHLLSLINDILDLSKVEAGKMTLDLETVSVGSVFVNSLSIIREKAAARRIRLDLDLGVAEDLGAIQADPRKVKQILYNLLSNAVKFTPEGGLVTLRASHVVRASIGHGSGPWSGRHFPLPDSTFADFLEIRVTDSGIGISPEGLEQLFRPFSQIDSGLARKFEGTGLGLAMVKLLAELHGGSVAVESAVGEGSCFTVWLPIRTAGEASVPSDAAPAAPPVETMPGARTALVVEDDEKSAELIRVQLEAEGFTVLHAISAETALVLAAQQPLVLITLDIMLPNMDGWEFLGRIKQVPALSAIPVVIISIVAERNKGFALGAAAVMQKPISREELYGTLVNLGLFPISARGTLKVLVVDDDPKAVELIALRMKSLASTVIRAYGGREAIEAARQERPDLIVLDLMMPDVNGFDVVEALKAQPDTARIPVVIVTAKHITTEDRAKLTGYVSSIMEKVSFDPDGFTAEVRRAMSGRRLVA